VILSGKFVGGQSENAGSRRTYASRDIPYPRMMWDMARYLPAPVAVLWSQVVEEFIRRPMVQRLRVQEQEEIEELDQVHPNVDEASEAADAGAKLRKKRNLRPRGDGFAEEVQELIHNLTGQLLDKVHEIREKSPTLQFPEVPTILSSTPQHRRSIALEFVRSLCHVLSLDQAGAEDVASMRRSLLRLLGVREFAKESQFIDPALPVPLHDVICTFCNAVVDLDIARDTQLWTEKEESADGEPQSGKSRLSWACEYCGNPYDMRQIELDLVRIVQKLYTSYHVQDLMCRKCNMVKRENMGMHCSCSGAPYELSMSRELLHSQLHAMQSVAKFHQFQFLLETVSWISESTSA